MKRGDVLKHVVVAGASSFLAGHLLPMLSGKYRVTGLSRRLGEVVCSGIDYAQLELANYDQFSKIVSSCDIYVPFIWAGTKREERASEQVNEASFHAVMESVRQAIAQGCQKIILPGTCAEFANDGQPIDEETAYRPDTPYGRWKQQLYQETKKLCADTGTHFLCLRMFSVYGSDDRRDKMINSIWGKLCAGASVEMTEGLQLWSFLHVDDAARAFLLAVESEDLSDGCYNLAATEHRRLRDFVEEMREAANSSSEICYGAVPYADGKIPHTLFLSRKAGSIFSWQPKISFSEGIRRMKDANRM